MKYFLVLLFLLVSFSAVKADPISISGNVTLIGGGVEIAMSASLTGLNFSADVVGRAAGNGICNTITPGGCTGANMGFVGSVESPGGFFMLNGTTYFADINNFIGFQISAPTFLIPLELLGSSAIQITAPFSFSGRVRPYLGDFTDLSGEGTVELFLVRGYEGVPELTGLYLARATYTFGSVVSGTTIQAVPEPTTILIFVTGLVGICARVSLHN